ncbi:hypothetical protein KGF51_18825 [Clostridioides sp. ZZV14-6045]|uniref:hypothetical protein n=1 Tax=Clostridioides sp. ZZV14-6045 TaxID=2811489 RepID=UPI001D12E6C8|nr:hypothetical protein [Clostridioides sp. ZZV14-6045]
MKPNIELILEKNEEFSCLSKLADSKYLEVKKLNESIDLEELVYLPYIELKKLYDCIKNRISSEKLNQIKKILIKKAKEFYPGLNKVHNYPEINNITFLNEDIKIKLDELLTKYENEIIIPNFSFLELQTSNEINIKIIDFLYDSGMLEKIYNLKCICEESKLSISEKKFNKMKDIFSLGEDDFAYVDCDYCNGREIFDLETLNESVEIKYRFIRKSKNNILQI